MLQLCACLFTTRRLPLVNPQQRQVPDAVQGRRVSCRAASQTTDHPLRHGALWCVSGALWCVSDAPQSMVVPVLVNHVMHLKHSCADPSPSPQKHVSPCYDSLDVLRLFYLVVANPLHTVTVRELPVYEPSPAERADARLFANNVRQYMVRARHCNVDPCTVCRFTVEP